MASGAYIKACRTVDSATDSGFTLPILGFARSDLTIGESAIMPVDCKAMSILRLSIFSVILLAAASVAQSALPGGEIGPVFERGEELAESAQPEQGLTYLNFALELAEMEYGPDGPELVPFLTGLASLYSRLGDIEDAEPLYLRVIALAGSNNDLPGEGLAVTVQNLGAIYEVTEREGEARQLYIDVLKTWQTVLGKEHEAVEVARNKLSSLDGPTAVASIEGTQPPEEPGDLVVPEDLPAVGEGGQGQQSTQTAEAAANGDAAVSTEAPTATEAVGTTETTTATDATQTDTTQTDGGSDIGGYKGQAEPLEPGDTSEQVAALPGVEEGASAGFEPLPGYRVHLMSVRSADGARDEWRRFQADHPELLGKLSLEIEEVDLGAEKGRWYRILAGPLSKEKARNLCKAFKDVDVYCQVRPPREVSSDIGAEGTNELAAAKSGPGAQDFSSLPSPAVDPSITQMHLSSVRKVKSTLPEWERLQKVFGTQLSDLDLRVRRVYLGELGRWYRIFAGPIGARDGEARCVEIRRQGQWCKVMPDHGEIVVVTAPTALVRPSPMNRRFARRRPSRRKALQRKTA